MTTFKTPAKEKLPERQDWRGTVRRLGLDAVIIAENLALEKRSERPFKIRDPHWWLHTKHSWVIGLDCRTSWQWRRCAGNFFDEIQAAPPACIRAYVLRSDGLFIRAYERVYSYFRRLDDFSILHFSQSERELIWQNLKRSLRQRSGA